MAKDLSDADDGKVFGVDDNLAPGSSHAFSAGAEKVELCGGGASPRLDGAEPRPHMSGNGYTPSQRLDQLRAVHFAGGFAGGDQDLHVDIVKVWLFECG